MDFKPIAKVKIVDTIIDLFSESIISKSLKAGERLPSEQELMKQFGVGRSSVREALKALEALGLITRNTEGVFVAELEEDFLLKPFSFLVAMKDISMQEIFEIRSVLEVHNAKMAAERANKANLEEIKKWAYKDAPDDEKSKDKISLKFHLAIAKATQNMASVEIVRSFKYLLLKSYRTTSKDNGDHKDIYLAIEKGDVKQAGELMNNHLSKVYFTQ